MASEISQQQNLNVVLTVLIFLQDQGAIFEIVTFKEVRNLIHDICCDLFVFIGLGLRGSYSVDCKLVVILYE